MKKLMYLLFLSFFAYGSVYGGFIPLFNSLRASSGQSTYHFTKVNKFEPITEPIIYDNNDNTKMIIGFNNMVVFGNFENDKHYVIRINEDLDEDSTIIPKHFLTSMDSGELFDIVTLKPTTTTTTTTQFPRFKDRIKDIQREALPDFDPDKQSFQEYLMGVSTKFSRMNERPSD